MDTFIRNFLKESILAGAFLILAKFIGILVGLKLTKTTFIISFEKEILPVTRMFIESSADLKRINSIAGVVVLVACIISGVLVILRSIYLNEVGSHPKIMAKIVNINLLSLLESYDHIYPRLVAWNIYIVFAATMLIRDYLNKSVWLAIPIIMTLFAIIFTYVVFGYIDGHINIISFYKKDGNKYIKEGV